MGKRWLRWILVLTAIVVPGIWLARTWQGREHLLLEQATRIGSADDFVGWLNDHTILRFNKVAKPLPQYKQVDSVTGVTKSFPIPYSGTTLANFSFSPDGKRLLWNFFKHDGQVIDGQVSTLNIKTGRSVTWPTKFDLDHSHSLWMYDNRHWLQIDDYDHINLYNVDEPGSAMKLPLSNLDESGNTEYSMTTQGNLQAWNAEVYPPIRHIRGYRLLPKIVLLRDLQVRMPTKGDVEAIVPDAEGRRLAWVLKEERQQTFRTRLHHWIPAIRAPSASLYSLWVTRLDGSDAHELGYIPWENSDEDWYPTVTWVPGDKRLSFLYNDLLYTVPSD